ncbi:hypothetical protein [Nonomuraea rubra]
MITVPGNKKAYYTFGVMHGKVTEYGVGAQEARLLQLSTPGISA